MGSLQGSPAYGQHNLPCRKPVFVVLVRPKPSWKWSKPDCHSKSCGQGPCSHEEQGPVALTACYQCCPMQQVRSSVLWSASMCTHEGILKLVNFAVCVWSGNKAMQHCTDRTIMLLSALLLTSQVLHPWQPHKLRNKGESAASAVPWHLAKVDRDRAWIYALWTLLLLLLPFYGSKMQEHACCEVRLVQLPKLCSWQACMGGHYVSNQGWCESSVPGLLRSHNLACCTHTLPAACTLMTIP